MAAGVPGTILNAALIPVAMIGAPIALSVFSVVIATQNMKDCWSDQSSDEEVVEINE